MHEADMLVAPRDVRSAGGKGVSTMPGSIMAKIKVTNPIVEMDGDVRPTEAVCMGPACRV